MDCSKSWKEVMKGYYICPATEFSHYEIMVTYHAEETPWLTSKGNLYLVGDYFNYPGSNSKHFERELLVEGNSVQNLIEYATEHYSHLRASACASDGIDMQERRTYDNSGNAKTSNCCLQRRGLEEESIQDD